MPTIPKNPASITKTSNGQYFLRNVVVAYPDFYEPRPFKNDASNPPRFGGTVLIPKSATDVYDVLSKAIADLALEKHKLKKLPAKDSCLNDGDENKNEAYHGYWVLNLYKYPAKGKSNAETAPPVKDVDGKTDLKETDSRAPRSGDVLNVVFDLYTPKNFAKVSGGLSAVQFVERGELIGFAADTSMFEAIDEEPLDPSEA